MIECENCNASLALPNSSQPSSLLRCANCGTVFRTGAAENGSPDKLARRSMWFGIASLFLGCLAGIPAIYYSIRSFIQMKHTPTGGPDKFAAATGAILGGFGTLFISMVLLIVAGIAAVAMLFTNESKDPKVVLAKLDHACSIEMPEQFETEQCVTVLNMLTLVRFVDDQDPEKRSARLAVVRFFAQTDMNREQFSERLRELDLDNPWEEDVFIESTETLDWNVNGKPTTVIKETIPGTGPDDQAFELIRYHVLLKNVQAGHRKEDFGLSIAIRTPNETFDEAAIQKIFESFGPPDSVK